jgi:hypothetical protein
VLSGEIDVMGDTPSIGIARENTSTGLSREDIDKMVRFSIDNQLVGRNRDYIKELIKNYIDSLGISSTNTNDIEESTRVSIEVALEPIKESVSKLEADTDSQFKAVRDKLKTISDRAVEVPAAIAKNPTLPRKDKPNADSLPEWVRKDDRRFYSLLVDNSALLDKVADAIDLNPKDNSNLAISLFELGIHKQDGTALDSSSMSRIKYVVSRLKTAPESTLPLND